MEKLMYPVWKASDQSDEAFRDRLLEQLAPALLDSGVLKLRLSVVDDDVAAAAPFRIEASRPAMNGLLSFWLNSSVYRSEQEAIIEKHVARLAGYLVCESEPLVNKAFPETPGQRTHGMNEVVFLQRPPRLSYEDWITIWHGSHTRIAIETQSIFGYRQNVIVRPLTYAAPRYDAIIEENFPSQAIGNREAFYDAIDDEALYKTRERTMLESCARFIDFDKIDCIPTSEYCLKS